MSTPQTALGANSNSAPSSSLYNSVSSMGMEGQQQETVQKAQPQMESLKDVAAKRFGAAFQIVENLFASYPGADEEATTVRTAMANWLKTAISKINESGQSSTY